MRVIETWIASKSGCMDDCEDSIFQGEHHVAVIDGVTHDRLPGSGRIAAHRVTAAMEDLSANAGMEEAVGILSESLASGGTAPGGAACAAIYSRARREVWLIGDCQALIGGRVHSNPLAGDALLGDVRAMVLEAALLGGTPLEALRQSDPGRAAIVSLLDVQRTFANRADAGPFGYAVLNGMPVPTSLLRCVPVPDDVNTLILASDGYPQVMATLAASEAALAGLLKEDPLCIRKFRSTKGWMQGASSFDDRAYVRLEV